MAIIKLLAVLSLYTSCCYASIEIIRGVEMKNQAFYDPSKDFTCLDGSRTIPFSSVNDDYCDCPDSSDEPGTSACPDGKFFCVNKGFRSKYIQASRVNDGLCDCCDGSDEYDSHVACYNECQKQGEADRLKREQEHAEANAGFLKKQEYIQQGEATRSEKQTQLDSINSQLEERRSKLEELRATKETAETPEKEAKEQHEKEWQEIKEKIKEEKDTLERTTAFTLLDTNKNGWIEMSELMSNHHMNNDVTEDESKDLLGGEAMLTLESFTNVIWEALKPRFLKDGRQAAEQTTQEEETTTDEGAATGEEGAINEGDGNDEEDGKEQMPPIETPPAEGEIYNGDVDDEDEDDDVDNEEDNDDDDDDESGDYDYGSPQQHTIKDETMPEYPEETKKLMEVADAARNEFNTVDNEVQELERKQREHQEYLNLDFGKSHEFSALKGDCREYTDREYTYKLCPFEKVTQRSKSGGSETDLGRWGKWVQEGDYTRMIYENGQGCWNGPSRSTTEGIFQDVDVKVQVTLSCGQENTVVSVSEPSRCEYNMEFKTPALCESITHQHQEL